MSAEKHTPTLPRLYTDKVSPGVIRMEGADELAGILAGRCAAEIVLRCNAHDALLALLHDVFKRDSVSVYPSAIELGKRDGNKLLARYEELLSSLAVARAEPRR